LFEKCAKKFNLNRFEHKPNKENKLFLIGGCIDSAALSNSTIDLKQSLSKIKAWQ